MQLRNRAPSTSGVLKTPKGKSSVRKASTSSRSSNASSRSSSTSKRVRLHVASNVGSKGRIEVVTAESHGRSTLQSPIANRTRTRSITQSEPSSKATARKPRARSRKLVSPRPSPKKLQSKPQPTPNRRKTPTPQPIVEPVVEEQSSEDDPNDSLQSESTIDSSLNSEDLEESNIIANISPETSNTNSHTMYTAPEHSQPQNYTVSYDEHMEFDPYYFIKHIPPLDETQRNRQAVLPCKTRQSPEYTLVLDLDETLVHCSLSPISDFEFSFPITFQDVKYEVYVKTRPYFKEFLQQMASIYEIIIFTASKKVYADKLISIIDPEKKLVRHRLFRENCVCVQGNYVKDLSILGRDLSKTIIVDNSPQAFAYHLLNGIPIESWYTDPMDRELEKLEHYLRSVVDAKHDDIRPELDSKFQLTKRLPPDQ